MLSRLGWTRASFKPGVGVRAEFYPLLDAREHGGALRTITALETGKSYSTNLFEQEKL